MKKIIFLLFLASCAYAYSNDSMTGPYQKLVHNDPVHAIHDANTAAWGDWFWLILAAGPYIAITLHQRTIKLSTLWLTTVLATYGYLLGGAVPTFAFYLMAAAWVMSVLIQLLSPKFTN